MHQPGYGQPGYGQPGYAPPPPPAGPPGFGPPPPAYAPAPPSAPPPAYTAYPSYPPPAPQAPQAPQAPAGPDFLAADRHNSVVVDATGVAFEMGALSADFPWQVIRGVHYRASTDGKVLIMAVVHVDGRMFECVVDAKRRERLQEWFAGLAAVLGHYRPAG